MIVAVHQPQYLPWLGYFDKIDKCDVFVILDDVQYKKNEWQNRNKIRNAQGWQWITVPVKYDFGQKINEVAIDNSHNWKKEHFQSLTINYNKAPYFKEYEAFFQKAYERDWERLSEINVFFIKYLLETLGLKKEVVISSQLKTFGQRSEKLVEICKKLKADAYLSGSGAKEYLDLDPFKKNKIKVIFQDFQHPIYKQVYNGFEQFMSTVDLLFNCGEKSLEILRGGKV